MPDEDGVDLVEAHVEADGAVLHDAAFGLEEEQVVEVEAAGSTQGALLVNPAKAELRECGSAHTGLGSMCGRYP